MRKFWLLALGLLLYASLALAANNIAIQQPNGTWAVISTTEVSNVHTLNVKIAPGTTGGLTKSFAIMAASTNATSVKASAGQVYHIQVFNNSANIGYLKFYDKASSPTCNSDTVVWEVLIPASTSGAGAVVDISSGLVFSTGIAYCVTGAIAVNDNTAVAASAMIVNLGYK